MARGVRRCARYALCFVPEMPRPLTAAAVTDPSTAHTLHDVPPRVRRATDVHVPHPGDLTPSEPASASAGDEDAAAHQARLEALFEWVGMACLGAQRYVCPSMPPGHLRMTPRCRLRANDRVDPYVAVYEAPAPASVDDVVHLRWKGSMDSAFVQSVINTAV